MSASGSIDWCCLPRFDSPSAFGRLLDWQRGGHCSLGLPDGERAYLDGTLVLATTYATAAGRARVLDCLVAPPAAARDDGRRLLRVAEGLAGGVTLPLEVAPRFDYGHMGPWLRDLGDGAWSATGGDDGLLVWSEAPLAPVDGGLAGSLTVAAGERVRTLIAYVRPEALDGERPSSAAVDRMLDETIAWWREFSDRLEFDGPDAAGVRRSAHVLKALTYAPTGGMAAAPTTSLPEVPGGSRNWDYRYSWIRDSVLASRSLAEIGCATEADAFRRFVERSTAGDPADMRIVYGVGGERRLPERVVDELDGYGGDGPVRIGNAAGEQMQLDACAQVVDESLAWLRRGHPPRDDYWDFLFELVDSAVVRWPMPDAGIWEWRGEPRHFVHSKALCWVAVDRGLELADAAGRDAPVERWRAARDEIRAAIDAEGVDGERGTFVQAFGARDLDAALLRLPMYGFVDYRDERMLRTVEAIEEELSTPGGFVRRYAVDDGIEGEEGAFLACSFWLAEVLAHQGRDERARAVFDRAAGAATDLGLMAEEVDPADGAPRGNYPQALTHLSHIEAALALAEVSTPATR